MGFHGGRLVKAGKETKKRVAVPNYPATSTCAFFAQVAADGKLRQMDLYNLDVIIGVGYRVNSIRGT
jgi:hypothetical protein